MLVYNWLLINSVSSLTATVKDYWSEDFDSSKNCESKEEVKKLQNQQGNQCNTENIQNDGDEAAFKTCVRHLNKELGRICERSKVLHPGKLLYCKDRGQINCCFKDQKCANWLSINNEMAQKAKNFLENTTGFLDFQINKMGYKTCHRLESLDATKCAKDCEEQEKGKFAEKCKEKGGLFKCCIVRDKEFCHECR